MATALSDKLERFFANPCHSTWTGVKAFDSAVFQTFFREQGTVLVGRQRNLKTLDSACKYLASIIEDLEVIPDTNKAVLDSIRLLQQITNERVESLREEEASKKAKEAAKAAVHQHSGAMKTALKVGGVFAGGLFIYIVYRAFNQ